MTRLFEPRRMRTLACVCFLIPFSLQVISTQETSYGQDSGAAATPAPAQESVAPPPAPVEIRTFDDLVGLLKKDNVAHKIDKASKAVVLPIKKDDIEGVQVIRWADQDGVAHFVQTMSLKIPKERLTAVEAAASRLNHATPVAGLGVNYDDQTVYFRMSVPIVPRGGLSAAEVRVYFQHTLRQALRSRPAMDAVIKGESPETIVQFAANMEKKKNVIPGGAYECTIDDAKWELKFTAQGEISVIREGKEVAKSKATFEGDKLTLVDQGGEASTEKVGVYQFSCDGRELTFRRVKDEAGGRAAILSSTLWRKVMPKKDEEQEKPAQP